jgi:2,4-dienoyl-CoA reductase-like NADH-dependent reductase (Old Yellow Enzyme family)/thioredoxin reductase
VTERFPHLAAPLAIGKVVLRNRMVMAPHSVSFLPGYGSTVDRVIDYHVERAKGGIAMIVMSNFVVPRSWRERGSWGGRLATTPLGGLDVANDAASIPAYRRLCERVHDHGAVFVAQLNAPGRQYWAPGALSFGVPLWAPSALPCPKLRQIPKAMEVEDIEEYAAAFAEAAANMREAGADGVEVFAAQGYLLSSFLSPHSNRRKDGYGGSLENRMRFLLAVLDAVRRVGGGDFLIGVRMNADDFTPGGIDLAAACPIARKLKESGLVDYLNVSGMTSLQFPGWIADVNAPEALFADQAAAIRKEVPRLPVCVVSRIGSPEIAERVLAQGQADMVGMARALIADPEFPNKTLRGDSEGIRRCTFSNQSCIMGHAQGRGVGCLHNVAVGKEAQLGIGTLKRAALRKKVVVVGGGPAGMAAARIAAERGHNVILYEAKSELGGQNRMTAQIASRRGFAEVTRWQEVQLRRHNVRLALGVVANADTVLNERADAVVLATGSMPRRAGYSSRRPDVEGLPGADLPHVRTIWDVFDAPGSIGKHVALIDEDPHMAAIFVAERLADLGHAVRIVTPEMYAGRDIHANFIADVYRRLRRKGVTIDASTSVLEIRPDDLLVADCFTGEARTVSGIDNVVLAMGNQANDGLARELKGRVGELHVVGDCLAPRRIDDAVLDGERAGHIV